MRPPVVVGRHRVGPCHGVALAEKRAEARDEVVGEVGRVRHPGEHADLVVELDADDRATGGLQPRRQHRHDRVEPAAALVEEGGRQVVDGARGHLLAVPAEWDDLRVVAVDPERDALVLQLGHDERPRARDEAQPLLGDEVDEGADVTLGAGLAGDVDAAVGQLVEDPRDVGGDGVTAGLDEQVEALAPLRARDAEVVHLPRHDDAGLAVDADLATGGLDHESFFVVMVTDWRRAESGPVMRTISPSSTRVVRSRPV